MKSRCPQSVSDDAATTYENTDQQLTALLTDFYQKWPDLTTDARQRVFAFCLEHGDAELRAVVKAWPKLPEPVRAGIVAMVRTVSDGSTA